MSGRPRVLWLTKGLGLGGAERLIATSAPRLSARSWEVEVAYVLPWKAALVAQLRECGVRVHCLGASHRGHVSWIPRLRRLIHDGDFAIVHTHSPLPAVAARIAADHDGTKLVHTEHNVWGRYRWPTYALNAATYGRNDAVLAVSDGVVVSVNRPAWMPWLRLPPVEMLHHGIDEAGARRGSEAAAAARARLGLGSGHLVLGNVANFTPKKDHAGMLRAFALVAAPRPELRFVLIGTGPLLAQTRALATQLGVADRVAFMGSRDDVNELLPAFDLFVLGSRHEGLSIALIEAMAAGVPCVATRVGGVPEAVLDGEHGILVRPGDPQLLADAVAELLIDEPRRRRMSEAARTHALRNFGLDRAVARIDALYGELLAAP